MPRTAHKRLDVTAILAHLGGVAAARRRMEVLADAGDPVPTDAQMRKWQQRGSIPARWLVVLLEQAKLEGRPIDLLEFTLDPR